MTIVPSNFPTGDDFMKIVEIEFGLVEHEM